MGRKGMGILALGIVSALAAACAAPEVEPTQAPTPAVSIDLVALGDSTPAGYRVVRSYVDFYAEYIEEDLGVVVRVHKRARNGQRASELLTALREDADLRREVREAEVITVWTGFNDIYPAIGLDPEGGACGPWQDLDMDCVAGKVAGLNTAIEGIVNELLALCDPGETLVLLADVGNPLADEWQALGLLDALKGPVMDAWIDHISEVCEQNGLQAVNTYRVLNGPDGRTIAGADILQDDGLHFNSDGHRLLADLHREVGYGPLSR